MQIRYTLLAFPLLASTAFCQETIRTNGAQGTFSASMQFAGPGPYQAKPVTGAPYSAEETVTRVQTLADGTHITNENSSRKLYRDSAGRTRVERAAMAGLLARRPKSDVPMIVEITDPVAGIKYTLDPSNKIAHKQTLVSPSNLPRLARHTTPPTAVRVPADDAQDQVKRTVEKLDGQTIEGIDVQGMRVTSVYPVDYDGNDRPITRVYESWFSPELQLVLLDTDNDPRSGETTRKLTNISRSEPDPSLFAPPGDYTVVEEKGDFTITWGSQEK